MRNHNRTSGRTGLLLPERNSILTSEQSSWQSKQAVSVETKFMYPPGWTGWSGRSSPLHLLPPPPVWISLLPHSFLTGKLSLKIKKRLKAWFTGSRPKSPNQNPPRPWSVNRSFKHGHTALLSAQFQTQTYRAHVFSPPDDVLADRATPGYQSPPKSGGVF